MSWKKIAVEFTGVLPTLMHNGQMADPMNVYAKQLKEITGKRKKTDQDHLDMAAIEYRGSLYLDAKGQPCWPGLNIHRCIQDGAKKTRRGRDVEAGILVDGDWPLIYEGPKDPEKLFADDRFRLTVGVGVNNSTVMRTRPRFPDWSLRFELYYMPEVCNPADIKQFCEAAGIYVGLSDWRPRYGRFEVTKFSELDDSPRRNGRVKESDFVKA